MNRILLFVALAICVSFMGCPTRSLSPLFNEKDVVFNQTLIGTWKNVKEPDILIFQKSGEKDYTVSQCNNNGDSSQYKIQLGQLGKFLFIDSYPASNPDDYHLLPTHVISRIWLDGDTLRISFLEGDWLIQMINSNKLDIPHGRCNGDIILTASTIELQKLVLRYAENNEAFPTPDIFVRVR